METHQHALGIALGEESMSYGVADSDGKLLFRGVRSVEAGISREGIIENIIKCIDDALFWCEGNKITLAGLGIGTPGIIDNGLILGGAENLPEWDNLPLGGLLSRRFDLPVFVDNDKNLEGLAEFRFGCAKGDQDVVFINIGTTIGGTMIINGRLYGGHRNRGAEFGHLIVEPNGRRCSCGAAGCLEAYASTSALLNDYKTFSKQKRAAAAISQVRQVADRYLQKETAAVKSFDLHFDYLATAIAGLINVISPQKVIIAGELPETGAFYMENLRKRVASLVLKETSVFTSVVPAGLGDEAGILGAAALVFERCGSTNLHPNGNLEKVS